MFIKKRQSLLQPRTTRPTVSICTRFKTLVNAHVVRIGQVISASEQLPKIPPISTPELSMTMCPTNKLTAAEFDHADKKASKFNVAKFYLVGNNSTGDNKFGRNERF